MKKIQNFTVSHLNEKDFKSGGLRKYSKYRDLGIAKATNGLAHAQVIKMIPPRTDEVSVWHQHDIEFQLVYILEGWIMNEFDGLGPIVMRKGSCWIQPPNINHIVHDYSDDCEMLEIILPADFKTIETNAGAPQKYLKPSKKVRKKK